MTIAIGGIASGIDTDSLVSQLVSIEQQPITDLNTKKSQIDAASSTISSLSSKLSTLKSAALALSTTSGFASFAASSSDSAVVASASGSSSNASYSVNVTQLAKAQKSRSDVVPSASTALGSDGSLSITVGTGTPLDIAVSATDSLSDIAAKITASGARVSASVFNDGTGYRLLVQGLDTGAANAFTMNETGVSLGLSTAANTYDTAQDAKLTIDGMPVTSKTNQITGAIAGVTLALTKITTTPATVQVTTDPTALEKKISTFVSAYNDFVNSSHAAAGFGSAKASNPILAADSTVRSSLHQLGSLMSHAVPGTSGKYTSLASIGLTTKNDGTAAFDATKLEAALTADPTSVSRLFVTDTVTASTGAMKSFMTSIDALVTGVKAPFANKITSLGTQSKRIADTTAKMQVRLDDYQAGLKKKFSDMDQAVAKYNALAKQLPTTTT